MKPAAVNRLSGLLVVALSLGCGSGGESNEPAGPSAGAKPLVNRDKGEPITSTHPEGEISPRSKSKVDPTPSIDSAPSSAPETTPPAVSEESEPPAPRQSVETEVPAPTPVRARPSQLPNKSADGTLLTSAGLPITSIVFWPDGSKFATASGGAGPHYRQIEVWDSKTFERLRNYETDVGAQPRIDQISLSPDAKMLAAAAGTEIKLFDTSTGRVGKKWQAKTKRVTSVAYSSDGSTLVSGDADKAIRVWNVADGSEKLAIKDIENHIYQVDLSPNGKHIACASGKSVHLFDSSSGNKVAELAEHESTSISVKFSTDGSLVAAGALNRTIRVWNVESKKVVHVFEGHGGDVVALAFTPDGKYLVSGAHDRTLRVWNLSTGKGSEPLWGHRDWIGAIAISPNGKLLLSSSDRKVRQWNLEKAFSDPNSYRILGQEQDSFQPHAYGGPTAVAISSDGKTVFTNAHDGWIGIWDVETKKAKHKLPHSTGSILPITLSNDGKFAAYGERYSKVRLIDSKSGKEVFMTNSLDGFVRDLAFTPDDKLLLVATGKNVTGLRVPSGDEAFSWEADSEEVEAMILLPDGKRLITGGQENNIKLWDLATKKLLKKIRGGEDKIITLHATPDGTKFVSVDIDNNIKVWDIESGAQLREVQPSGWRIDALLILPDNKTVVFALGKSIVFWNLQDGRELRRLNGHLGTIHCMCMTSDAETLITGSGDGTLKFWDISLDESDRQDIAPLDRPQDRPQEAKLTHAEALAAIKKSGGFIREEGTPPTLTVILDRPDVTDSDLKQLQGLTNLTKLNLRGLKVTDAGLAHIQELTDLTELQLSYANLTDASLGHLKGLTKLTTLTLVRTKISDPGLEQLEGLTSLTDLKLMNPDVTAAGLDHIKRLTKLTRLKLSGSNVTDAGLEHLKALNHLIVLDLSQSNVTDTSLEHIKGLTKLQALALGSTPITDAGLEHIEGLTNLILLSLSRTQITDASLEQLMGLANLKALYLDKTKVSSSGVKKLQQALPKCKISF